MDEMLRKEYVLSTIFRQIREFIGALVYALLRYQSCE